LLRGPSATGERLVNIAEQLWFASSTLLSLSADKKNFDRLKSMHHREMAIAWMERAAETSARARYWLARKSRIVQFISGVPVSRKKRLKEAAYPEPGVQPFNLALVDLAEMHARPKYEEYELNEARRYLDEAILKMLNPDDSVSIRLADLLESLYGGQRSREALKLYVRASNDSQLLPSGGLLSWSWSR